MEDIASARLAEERVENADQLRKDAEQQLEAGNEAAAAELFAFAGDKFAAAADDSGYKHKREQRMQSARLCWRLADEVESNRGQHLPDRARVNDTPGQRGDFPQDSESPTDDNPITDLITEDVEVDFDDYVGREDLKEKMERKVFSHAKNPDLDEEFGIEPANGFILYGPPGTGKTFFVRCMAGETQLPFVELDITELTSKYVNESAQLIGDIFGEIRNQGPMMVCINELDAVAKSRDSDMTSSEQKAINKLLTEVEALKDSRTIIVGTTNKPAELDRAVTRSGRFTDKYEVDVPGEEFRREAIQQFMADRPLADEWDVDAAVELTQGCTPADLEELCNEAARIGRDHYKETGEKGITTEMFETAFEDLFE